MYSTNDMILVVHVPKTAGTSFRQALDKSFGTKRVIRDYGSNTNANSDLVKKHVYDDEKDDRQTLIRSMSESGAKVLIGHFQAEKYAPFFEPSNIVTFVRDPLERTCSEYLHRVRHHNYQHSFEKFLLKSNIINIQSRYLNEIPEGSLIGVTEHYGESLRYINSQLGLALKERKENIDKAGGGCGFAKNLTNKQRDQFFALNEQDVKLYDRCLGEFRSLDIPQARKLNLRSLFKNR